MKIDFQSVQKILAALAVVGTLSGVPSVFASSTDGAPAADIYTGSLEGARAHGAKDKGRALLRIEDFKTLLEQELRDTSGEGLANQDDSQGLLHFNLAIQKAEVQKLDSRVEALLQERQALEVSLTKEASSKKEDLKAKRRELQLQRLGSGPTVDSQLARSLFEYLLEENNLDASVSLGLEQFDSSHAFALDFVKIKGIRHVHTVYLDSRQVWSESNSSNIAKR